MLGHERFVHTNVCFENVSRNIFLGYGLPLAPLDVLLVAYLYEIGRHRLEVTSVRCVNTIIPRLEIDDLINDGLLVGAQRRPQLVERDGRSQYSSFLEMIERC